MTRSMKLLLLGALALASACKKVEGAQSAPQRPPAPVSVATAVERDVPRHEQLRAIGEPQILRRDAARLEHPDLVAEDGEIDDHAGAEDAHRVRVEDAGRDEMELERPELVDHGVARVVAALVADDEIRLLREEVRDLALALVAPLGSDDGGHRHVTEC